MNGDNINDIYVDGGDRIWLANYPAGVTIRNNRYQSYEWFRHSPGNSRSLVNDQVHDVIEDSRRRLVVRHQQRISLLQPAVGRWRSFLSRSDGIQDGGNHIFLTLCEVSPGVICAGWYAFRPVQDRKENREGGILSPLLCSRGRPDQYINDIGKDSGGCIWTGGCHNLKRFRSPMTAQYACPGPGPHHRHTGEGIRNGCGSVPAWGCTCLTGTGGPADISPFQSRRFMSMHCTRHRTGSLYIGTGGAGLPSMTAWREQVRPPIPDRELRPDIQ